MKKCRIITNINLYLCSHNTKKVEQKIEVEKKFEKEKVKNELHLYMKI